MWLWISTIESEIKNIFEISISKERNTFVTEHFLSDIVDKYGLQPIFINDGTWCPQACRFLKLIYHIHFSWKSMIERTMQYKNRMNVV